MVDCRSRIRGLRGLLVLVAFCTGLTGSALAGEGFALRATSSPALSLGYEWGRVAVFAGAGFRWEESRDEIPRFDPVGSYEGTVDFYRASTAIVPGASVMLLSRSQTLPGYLLLGVDKAFAISTSVSGLDSEGNAAYEDYLESVHSELRVRAGLGVRASLSDRLSLGGEVGVHYYTVTVEPPVNFRFGTQEQEFNAASTYFSLTLFLYP